MRPRNQEKQDLVKKKTIEFLVEKGLEGFSANQVAKACNISMATLYIYYKDRDDMIIKIASEEVEKMHAAVLEGFDPESLFEDGLMVQWKNRYRYLIENPIMTLFFEQLRSSSYQDQIYSGFRDDFGNAVRQFMKNAILRGEIEKMPLEMYWSVAIAPLQALIRAHYEGKRSGGDPFILTEEIVWQTFSLVLKGLKK